MKNMFADFKNYLINLEKAHKTVAGYAQDMTLFADWFQQANGEPLSPQSLTRVDARQYRQYLLNEHARPATINRKLAALRAYSNWAKESGQVEFSLVNGIKNVEEQTTAPKWLNRKDQDKLLRELEKEVNAAQTKAEKRQAIRDRCIVVVLLNTGLRVSELCALELVDVVIRDRSGEVRVRQGKGSKARTVAVNKDARAELDEWLAVRPKTDNQGLFINKYGEPVSVRIVQRMIEEMGRRAGVEATPHTLRHSFAKNLVDSGVSLEKVAMLLGHNKLDTTMVYTTPSQNDLANAVEGISN
jgi:site-specific recombinase XerD